MRRSLLTAVSGGPLAGVNIGAPFMGGFYAGIIDTTKGNIESDDTQQVGARFALIVGGASLELSSSQFASFNGSLSVVTRWDGLAATEWMKTNTGYVAAVYCAGLSYPADGASPWYLPALDEMELLYRHLKCSTEQNAVGSTSGVSFPSGTLYYGANPSSDPVAAAYTVSDPAQTTVAAFQTGGAQALGVSGSSIGYWTSTQSVNTSAAWRQYASGGSAGADQSEQKTNSDGHHRVRPVRRLVLT